MLLAVHDPLIKHDRVVMTLDYESKVPDLFSLKEKLFNLMT